NHGTGRSVHERQCRRRRWRPAIGLISGCNAPIGVSVQKLTESGGVRPVMPRTEPRQVRLREPEQTRRRRQTLAVFCVRWMFEALLKVNESASRLNQSFEIVCIGGFGFEPKLFQNIMRLVIILFIPAMEKRAIKWMLYDVALAWIGIFGTQLRHKSRNPLAFTHQGA